MIGIVDISIVFHCLQCSDRQTEDLPIYTECKLCQKIIIIFWKVLKPVVF